MTRVTSEGSSLAGPNRGTLSVHYRRVIDPVLPEEGEQFGMPGLADLLSLLRLLPLFLLQSKFGLRRSLDVVEPEVRT